MGRFPRKFAAVYTPFIVAAAAAPAKRAPAKRSKKGNA